jgi:hypothetical protein
MYLHLKKSRNNKNVLWKQQKLNLLSTGKIMFLKPNNSFIFVKYRVIRNLEEKFMNGIGKTKPVLYLFFQNLLINIFLLDANSCHLLAVGFEPTCAGPWNAARGAVGLNITSLTLGAPDSAAKSQISYKIKYTSELGTSATSSGNSLFAT